LEDDIKAVISNRIYLNKPPEGFEKIKAALTYKIVQKGAGRGGKHSIIEVIRTYKILPRDIISIPQGRTDLIPEGYEIIDKRVKIDMPFPDPRVQLRPEQQLVYDAVNDSCFINALPGWGKTFTALHIARKLGQKTLVIAHTTMLRDQWIEEIEEIFGFKPGIIGSGEYDIDSSIVVGNIQSVTKHALILAKEFGTVVVDEAHHIPATTFSSLVDSMYARYRIALSGTMIRKDGKHILFTDYFGNTVHRPPQSHTLDPRIKLLKSGISLAHGEIWTKKINSLLYDPEYQEYIGVIAMSQMAKGHSVLVIADRVEFLTRIKEFIGEKCMLVTGETGFEERKVIGDKIETGEVTCIAGSRQIFSEGISMNRLSCVILASPIANEALLEQIVGRIMRKHDKKPPPEVIDIQFSGIADRKQNNVRMKVYMEKGWEIEHL
jgi:superfamily II DNA or RNA helicase